MALGKLDTLRSYSIVAAWSASTIPSRDWWNSLSNLRLQSVVACGDNDVAGQSFNQRIAGLVGGSYHVHWPADRPPKHDMRDEIVLSKDIRHLIDVSIARGPIKGLEKQELNAKRTYTGNPGLISRLIEAAGGRLAFQMAEGTKWYCPLHDDREDASLTANDETGSWKCWAGCGSGGPVQFIMAWKNVGYKEALVLLKRYS